MKNFDKSPLWDSILEEDFFKNIDINSFKDNGANTRISQYSYETHGLFFFKNILFQMAKKIGKDNLSLLHSIPNRQIGGGVNINYEDILVDIDYLLALEEVIFLRDKLEKIDSILEIGAGYGRTCHSILSLFPNVTEYHIIDLPSMLDLSKTYLRIASQENFSKITFISVNDIIERQYDLIVNIDSMQEMSQETVKSYLKYIYDCGRAFYSKNTIGKYDPILFGWENSMTSELAKKSGVLNDVINLFCPQVIKEAQKNFLSAFLPGKNWVVEKHAETLPWSHYYQALFVKNA